LGIALPLIQNGADMQIVPGQVISGTLVSEMQISAPLMQHSARLGDFLVGSDYHQRRGSYAKQGCRKDCSSNERTSLPFSGNPACLKVSWLTIGSRADRKIGNARASGACPTEDVMEKAERPSPERKCTVYRQDDNGNRFLVQRHLSREDAERMAEE